MPRFPYDPTVGSGDALSGARARGGTEVCLRFVCSVFTVAVLGCLISCGGQSTQISKIFQPDNIGATTEFVEALTGVPWRVTDDRDFRQYKVEGCVVGAGYVDGRLEYLQLEISDLCTFDLGAWLPVQGLPPLAELRLQDFERAKQTSRYMADCLQSCGNGFWPSPYLVFEGSRAEGSVQVVLMGRPGDVGVEAWANASAPLSSDELSGSQFNCDPQQQAIARKALASVRVGTITIGARIGRPHDGPCAVPYGAFAPKALDL